MRCHHLLLLASLAGGCNQVLGLDPVTARGGDDDDAPGPIMDEDGDGVADEVDNCPKTVNAHQDDEDRDGRGNLCDPCPFLDEGDDPINVDGDALADACDFDPINRQCIVWFDGFDRDTLARYQRPTPEVTYGTWVVDPDAHALVQTDPSAPDGVILTADNHAESWVRTEGVVRQRSSDGVPDAYVAGIWLRARLAAAGLPPDGAVIALAQQQDQPVASVIVQESVGGAITTLKSAPLGDGLVADKPITVEASARNEAFDGRAIIGTGGQIVNAIGTLTLPGAVGLRTHDASIEFDYLMIVDPDPIHCPPAPAACACPPPIE